jgi:hypothetical protein
MPLSTEIPVYIPDGARNDPVFDLLIKSFSKIADKKKLLRTVSKTVLFT